VLSTDQTHLRKYLATLGVAIAAGTLSLAGLFLKLQEDLLVTTSTLAQLTPTSRAALLERQRYLAFGTYILPYFVLIGFLGGLSLATYGLIGWRERQRVADALEDISLQRGRVEFRQMTTQEQAEKLTREAEESVDVARASATPGVHLDNAERHLLVSSARKRAMILESRLQTKLKEALGSNNVLVNLRASPPSGRVEVDAIARRGKQNIVFELKYAVDTKSALNRIRDALMQLSLGVHAVEAAGRDNVSGVAIVVVPDAVDASDLARIVAEANDISSSFDELRVVVMTYSEFLSLSSDDLVSRLFGGGGVSGQAA
jgi:hypothetical protein